MENIKFHNFTADENNSYLQSEREKIKNKSNKDIIRDEVKMYNTAVDMKNSGEQMWALDRNRVPDSKGKVHTNAGARQVLRLSPTRLAVMWGDGNPDSIRETHSSYSIYDLKEGQDTAILDDLERGFNNRNIGWSVGKGIVWRELRRGDKTKYNPQSDLSLKIKERSPEEYEEKIMSGFEKIFNVTNFSSTAKYWSIDNAKERIALFNTFKRDRDNKVSMGILNTPEHTNRSMGEALKKALSPYEEYDKLAKESGANRALASQKYWDHKKFKEGAFENAEERMISHDKKDYRGTLDYLLNEKILNSINNTNWHQDLKDKTYEIYSNIMKENVAKGHLPTVNDALKKFNASYGYYELENYWTKNEAETLNEHERKVLANKTKNEQGFDKLFTINEANNIAKAILQKDWDEKLVDYANTNWNELEHSLTNVSNKAGTLTRANKYNWNETFPILLKSLSNAYAHYDPSKGISLESYSKKFIDHAAFELIQGKKYNTEESDKKIYRKTPQVFIQNKEENKTDLREIKSLGDIMLKYKQKYVDDSALNAEDPIDKSIIIERINARNK